LKVNLPCVVVVGSATVDAVYSKWALSFFPMLVVSAIAAWRRPLSVIIIIIIFFFFFCFFFFFFFGGCQPLWVIVGICTPTAPLLIR
jgi:hypothetical protein